MNRQEIQSLLDKHGLAIKSTFIPFSQSRNKGNQHPSLNWLVTLHKGERAVITTDYSAGCGHCPAYKKPVARFPDKRLDKWANDKAIAQECETGKIALSSYSAVIGHFGAGVEPILPDSVDVLYSMMVDSDVLESSSFEDWAGGYGYDPDSIKGKAVYDACLAIALKLRSGLGEALMAELRTAFSDY